MSQLTAKKPSIVFDTAENIALDWNKRNNYYSGQEWYSRVCKEIDKIMPKDGRPLLGSQILGAAKKASGIK